MDCTEARDHLLDRQRGSLDADRLSRLEAHLAGCEACRAGDAADRALSTLLEERLPKRRAPLSLRRAIEARMGVTPPRPAARDRRAPVIIALFAAAALAATAVLAFRPRGPDPLIVEAVNDHLRVLYSEHPVEVESGGVHQVKPWFEGRLDFAPMVAFGGDDDFPLQGGSIAWFMDRKAAAWIYKRRLHVITLLVYRADGLAWPAAPTVPLGHARATEQTIRGFHALLWRDGDLGYALVSDLDPHELETLGGRIAGP